MATNIWKASKEVHGQIVKLIEDRHHELFIINDEICVVFRENAKTSGGQIVYGRAFKCSDYMNVLGDTAYRYVIELAADTWTNELDETQKEALLDSILCSMKVEEDANSGEIKCGIVKPDIQAFSYNVDKYGMWFPKEEEEDAGNS